MAVFAVIGLILYVIAAILELVSKYTDKVVWLLIIGGALVAVDVIWGWRYRRRGAP
jgi:hypothetical protein